MTYIVVGMNGPCDGGQPSNVGAWPNEAFGGKWAVPGGGDGNNGAGGGGGKGVNLSFHTLVVFTHQ